MNASKVKHVDVLGVSVTIRRRGHAWQLDYRHEGKRIRQQVETCKERDALLADLKLRLVNQTEARRHEARFGGAVALSRRTEADRTALLGALQAIEKAGGTPTDLLHAAERYVSSVLSIRQKMTLGAAVKAYAESRPARREATILNLNGRLNRFVEYFGNETLLIDIQTDAILKWLRESVGGCSTTFNHYRMHVRALFGFAIEKKWIANSPAAEIKRDKEEHDTPGTLSPVEVERLLLTAIGKYPELVPYIVIGVFAGLRPERELGLLAWSSIDLDNARIVVTASSSKHRRARNVPLSANAVAWLRRYAPLNQTGTVPHCRSRLHVLRVAAGVPWQKDILRHSYASYLLAQCEDEGIVASRMGNSVQIVRDHYNSARNSKEAAAFWAIQPPESGIIKFPKVEAA